MISILETSDLDHAGETDRKKKYGKSWVYTYVFAMSGHSKRTYDEMAVCIPIYDHYWYFNVFYR